MGQYLYDEEMSDLAQYRDIMYSNKSISITLIALFRGKNIAPLFINHSIRVKIAVYLSMAKLLDGYDSIKNPSRVANILDISTK